LKHYTILTIFIALFISVTVAAQQPQPLVLGQVHTLHSDVLHEERVLNVYLPDAYKSDTGKYPVIYLLDGSANEDFVHIAGLVQFLTMIEAMPPTIVVGIANIDRKRDFTYPTTIAKDKADFPTTGHSATFIHFLEGELLPFINKTFRTNSTTTLVGQSLGGLLATEILLKKEQMFSNYIIVSPSLWWDNQSLLSYASNNSQPVAQHPHKVYLSVGGKEHKVMRRDARKLNQLLSKTSSRNTATKFDQLPDESHLTILHNAAYRALVWLHAH